MNKVVQRNKGEQMVNTRRNEGFTIVELLIVVVVIAILAAITIVSFNGISTRAKETALKSDLMSGAKQIQVMKATDGTYPVDTTTIKKATTTVFEYTYNNASGAFCLGATTSTAASLAYYVTEGGSIQAGTCPPVPIQTIASAGCPTDRMRVFDARDNHTYWIQKLSDGNCWMLTNLAYAGGGTNTYSDTRTIVNGTAGSDITNTIANYYVVPATTNFTTSPTAPSTSVDGTGQYGYLYNFCGANAGQAGNGACGTSSAVAVNTAVSVCPAGWRLPTGNTGGELAGLNTAVNAGSTATDAGLRTAWFGQRGGSWGNGFGNTGVVGYYWATTQVSAANAYTLNFASSYTAFNLTNMSKYLGLAVRCVAY